MKVIKFNIELEQIFKDDKRDFVIIDREFRYDKNNKCKKYYKYHCNKCGAELWKEERKILEGVGCGCCSKNSRNVIKGINDIATTNPEMVKYFVNIEDAYTHTYCSGDKVLCKCNYCESEKEIIISNLYNYGFKCPICSDGISYPNKFMYNLLKQLDIKFINEYSPEWISPKRYDFYIPSIKLIIEMDGAFHNKNNTMENGLTAKQHKKLDNYKEKEAIKHGLKVIRINCDYGKNKLNRLGYIKNNIIKSIGNIIDLSYLNWGYIDTLTECNNLKICCDYHNDGLSVTNINKITNISKNIISIYLNKGTKLGWCNYCGEYERIKINGRKVEIFKDGEKLGVFNSARGLSKKSKELFGVYLDYRRISEVCRNVKLQYKGFEFKYLD